MTAQKPLDNDIPDLTLNNKVNYECCSSFDLKVLQGQEIYSAYGLNESKICNGGCLFHL